MTYSDKRSKQLWRDCMRLGNKLHKLRKSKKPDWNKVEELKMFINLHRKKVDALRAERGYKPINRNIYI